MTDVISLIEKLGFPVAICLAGGYVLVQMVSKMFSTLIEDAKEDKALLKDELEYNRQVGSELLATNKLLAQDLTNKVDNLGNKIDTIIQKQNN